MQTRSSVEQELFCIGAHSTTEYDEKALSRISGNPFHVLFVVVVSK